MLFVLSSSVDFYRTKHVVGNFTCGGVARPEGPTFLHKCRSIFSPPPTHPASTRTMWPCPLIGRIHASGGTPFSVDSHKDNQRTVNVMIVWFFSSS